MTMTLWHCKDARSLRALWVLEEMGLDYDLELLPFPPRAHRKDYFDVNPLGTVPFLRDGATGLTESAAICQYLAEKYAPDFGVALEYHRHLVLLLQFPTSLIVTKLVYKMAWPTKS